MHGRASNGGRHSGKPDTQGVPRPRLQACATQVGVQRLAHPELGEVAQMLIDAGDLRLEVIFPIDFAHPIGTELQALGGGVVVARPGDVLGKEPPK